MSKKLSKSTEDAATVAAFVQSVVKTLDALSIARDRWEKNEYKTATESLYDLLSRTYATYEQSFVNASDERRKALRSELVSVLKSDAVRVQKNTSTLGLLIRFVFRSDRKRVLRYRYAIEAAKSHGVASASLASWLTERGGIDAVAKLISAKEETRQKQQRLELALQDMNALIADRIHSPLASVSIEGFVAEGSVALIAQASIDGTLSIVCAVNSISDALRGNLIKCAAAQQLEQQDATEALGREARKFDEREAANDEQMKRAA